MSVKNLDRIIRMLYYLIFLGYTLRICGFGHAMDLRSSIVFGSFIIGIPLMFIVEKLDDSKED